MNIKLMENCCLFEGALMQVKANFTLKIIIRFSQSLRLYNDHKKGLR